MSMTWQGAAGQIANACTVAERLPCSFAALAAGKFHPVHLRIIADETAYLSDADAAEADRLLAAAAPSMTFGQLRYAAHRLVLKLDPDSARRRKEEATFRPGLRPEGMALRAVRLTVCDESDTLSAWLMTSQRGMRGC
jgi:hypothetical protein